MVKSLDEIIKNLKDSPLFNISLSSKELFHSNFIAWMIKKYPCEMEKVFGKILNKKIVFETNNEVERETKNIDLTINLKDKEIIIIENKVKSLPDKKQLKEYQLKFKDEKNIYFILLSFFEPNWDEKETPKWLFLSYETLANELKNSKIIEDKYVKDYFILITQLNELMKIFKIDKENKVDFFSYKNKNVLTIYQKLAEIKMSGIYHKVVFQNLKNLFEKESKLNIENIERGNNFSRGLSLVYLKLGDEEKGLNVVLQDSELGLYLFSNKKDWFEEKFYKNNKNLVDNYFLILKKINEKYNLQSKLYPTSKEKEFKTYNKTEYYKSIKLDGNPNLKVKEVLEILEKVLDHIMKSKDLQKTLENL